MQTHHARAAGGGRSEGKESRILTEKRAARQFAPGVKAFETM
jgi:hypothetical protein